MWDNWHEEILLKRLKELADQGEEFRAIYQPIKETNDAVYSREYVESLDISDKEKEKMLRMVYVRYER